MEDPSMIPMQSSVLSNASMQLVRSWLLDDIRKLDSISSTDIIKSCFGITGKPNEELSLVDIMTGVVNAVDIRERSEFITRLRDKTATGCLMEFRTDFGITVLFSKIPPANGKGPNTVELDVLYSNSTDSGVKKLRRTLMQSTGGNTTFMKNDMVSVIEDAPVITYGSSDLSITFRPATEGAEMDIDSTVDPSVQAAIVSSVKNRIGSDIPKIKLDASVNEIGEATSRILDNLLAYQDLKDMCTCAGNNIELTMCEYDADKGYTVVFNVAVPEKKEEVPNENNDSEGDGEVAEPAAEHGDEDNQGTEDEETVSREPANFDSAPAAEEVEPTRMPLSDITLSVDGVPKLRLTNKIWSDMHAKLSEGRFFDANDIKNYLNSMYGQFDWTVTLDADKLTMVASEPRTQERRQLKNNIHWTLRAAGHDDTTLNGFDVPQVTGLVKGFAPIYEDGEQYWVNANALLDALRETELADILSNEGYRVTGTRYDANKEEYVIVVENIKTPEPEPEPVSEPVQEEQASAEEQPVEQPAPTPSTLINGKVSQKDIQSVKEYIKTHREEWDRLSTAERTALIASRLTGQTIRASDVETFDATKSAQQESAQEPIKEEKEVKVRINCCEVISAEDYNKIRQAVESAKNKTNDELSDIVSDAVGYECIVEKDPDHPEEFVVTIPVDDDEETPPEPPDPNDPKNQLPPPPEEIPVEQDTTGLQEAMNSDKDNEPVKTNYLDLNNPDVRMFVLQSIFPGVVQPSYMHLITYLKDYHNNEGTKSFISTKGTLPTETTIVYNNITIAFVKMKDGKFWRIFVAHTDLGLGENQSWTETCAMPGRWVQLGADIQNPNEQHDRGYRSFRNRF